MELELKHLAPYLPYGLKWKFDGEDLTHDVVGLDITNRGVKLVSPYNDYGDCEISSGKPILLPTSSLYIEMEDGKVPMKVIGEMLEYDLKKYVDNDGDIFYGFELTDTSIPHKVPMEDREIYFIYFDTQSHWFYMVNQFLEVDSNCEHIPLNFEVADYLYSLHFDWRYGLIDKGLALDKTKIK